MLEPVWHLGNLRAFGPNQTSVAAEIRTCCCCGTCSSSSDPGCICCCYWCFSHCFCLFWYPYGSSPWCCCPCGSSFRCCKQGLSLCCHNCCHLSSGHIDRYSSRHANNAVSTSNIQLWRKRMLKMINLHLRAWESWSPYLKIEIKKFAIK